MPTAYKNPLEATQGLTSAFGPTTDAQKTAIAQASSLVPTTSPTVVTGATINEEVIPAMNKRLTTLTGGQTDAQRVANQGKPGFDVFGNQLPDGGASVMAAKESGGTYKGMDGQDYYNYDSSPVNAMEEDEYSASNSILEKMKSSLDQQTKALIEGIQSQYGVRKAQQADINKRSEAGTAQALLMGGSSRYAQISSGGIQQAQETYGLQQIAELDTQEKNMIAKAQAAQQEGNFKIMGEQLNLAEAKRKEKQDIAKELSDSIAAENKKLRDSMIAASRDSAVADLIGQGINDPAQILNMLNFDEKGNMIGDFTSKEISETLKNLTVEGKTEADFKTDLGSFNYLKDNGLLPEGITSLDPSQQYFAYLNMQKLANSGKLTEAGKIAGGGGGGTIPGKGAGNSVEEQIIRTRLFAKLATILNKGTLSDDDRAIIDSRIAEFRNAGMSEQEIMSQLAGFPADVKTPYNTTFIDLVAANTDTNEEQQILMGKVGQLLAAGNSEGAMELIERKAMEKAMNQVGKEEFINNADVKYVKDKTDQIEALLGDGWMNSVGAFTGTFNSWLSKKFGLFKSAEIRAKLGSLTSSLINKRAGSAITEEEWKRLIEPNIPAVNESAATWRTKLTELSNDALQKLNTERGLVSLPSLSIDEAIDPKKRLGVYASGTDDFWGGGMSSGESYQIYDPSSGDFEIPEE